jgi:hypothetical protein
MSCRPPVEPGVRKLLEALLCDREAMAYLYSTVEKGGLGVDEARDLVDGVINDTYIGTRAYDLKTTPREYVLEQARRERWRQAKDRARFVPLGERADLDIPAIDLPSDVEPVEPGADPADLPALVAFVRRAGADDPDLLKVLAAYESRAYAGLALRKGPVVSVTRLSPTRYHNARRRLRRLARVAVAALDSGAAVVGIATEDATAAARTLSYPSAPGPALRTIRSRSRSARRRTARTAFATG